MRECSPFVEQSLRRLGVSIGLALDIPCGSGRHALLLRRCGFDVVAADMNISVLHSADNIAAEAMRVQLDADKELPFADRAFDIALVIHPQTIGLLARVPQTLRTGGHLILESFGAQGDNWRGLPGPSEVLALVSSHCDAIAYLEREVQAHPGAVVVKGVFRRR